MIKDIGCCIIVAYLGMSGFAFGIGLANGNFEMESCDNYPTTRLAVLLPIYKLGCWFMEDIK